jgi:hypothetical protein
VVKFCILQICWKLALEKMVNKYDVLEAFGNSRGVHVSCSERTLEFTNTRVELVCKDVLCLE